MKKYDELKMFKCREGHFNVPIGSSENRSLGTWVNHQRAQYRKMKNGKPSNMTDARIRLLEKIGFIWNELEVAWMKKYNELLMFKFSEGHCNVPNRFSKNQSLGTWVSKQRTQYKLMKEGNHSNMTNARIKLLEDIEFMWTLRV